MILRIPEGHVHGSVQGLSGWIAAFSSLGEGCFTVSAGPQGGFRRKIRAYDKGRNRDAAAKFFGGEAPKRRVIGRKVSAKIGAPAGLINPNAISRFQAMGPCHFLKLGVKTPRD